jgi:Phage integrase, N-terminal SAM-like domain
VADAQRSLAEHGQAYAFDLKVFWEFLLERGLNWTSVGVMEIGEFAAWARRPASNVIVLSDAVARRSARSVNRMLTAVVELVVRAATKIVMEPIFEADMLECSFGFRPRRSAHDALQVLVDEA